MTNKTITLSRDLLTAFAKVADNYSDAEDDSFEPWQDAMMHEELRLTLGQFRKLRAALADPVPPAGGDVETVATMYVALRDDFNSFACLGRPGNGGPLYKEEPLVRQTDHHAQVTRLQADVERLHGRVREEQTYVSELAAEHTALQSELTKARELLRNCTDCVRNGEDFDLPVTTMSGIDAFLSNQSAPVDKGQGEPVGLQHMAVAEDGKLRWMSGRKMQNCELYALPDGSAIRFPLYAEQPAPVAVAPYAWIVVSPDGKEFSELQSSRDHAVDLAHDMDNELHGSHEGDTHKVRAIYFSVCPLLLPPARDFQCVSSGTFENGWNACLDEVARLNSEPKP